MEAGHEVHVLDGLRGGAFEQVVEARDDDESAGVAIEMEAEVAEAGAHDGLNLRQMGRAADADERSVCVEVVEAGLKFFDGARLVKTHVEGGEDSARDRQQMRRELNLLARKLQLLAKFTGV